MFHTFLKVWAIQMFQQLRIIWIVLKMMQGSQLQENCLKSDLIPFEFAGEVHRDDVK
jgi:hypothetical protein